MNIMAKRTTLFLIGLAAIAIFAIAFPPNYTIWKTSIANKDSTYEDIEESKGLLSSKVIQRSDVNPVYLEGQLGNSLNEIEEKIVSYEFFGWGFIVIFDENDEFMILIEDRI